MHRIRIVLLCLSAMFAFSAIGASSAFAVEENILFKFTNGNIENGGTFSGESTAESKLLTLAKAEVKCKSVLVRGEFLTAHLGDILVLFHKCTSSGLPCNSAGQPGGLIHVPLTLFHLGLAHLGGTLNVPAIIILLPAAGITFECPGVLKTATVTGNVIGELQNEAGERAKVKVPQKTVKVAFKQLAAPNEGMQELTLILLALGNQLLTGQTLLTEFENSGKKEESAQVSTTPLTNFKNAAGEVTEIELVEG